MRSWISQRCACEGRSCSDVKAACLALPGVMVLFAAFWSIGLF